MSVIRKMMEIAHSKLDFAVAWLLIGAIFFAMRSCEYLKTAKDEGSKRTKVLRIKNFVFKKSGKIVPINSTSTDSADIVIIVFEFQKNSERNQSVHMYRTKDKIMNPVLAWSRIIHRLFQSIPSVSGETKVCEFLSETGSVIDIDSKFVRTKLRAVVDLIGEVELGFGKDDIGLQSIRSGGAMAMFLSGVSEIIIKRVGRWKSDAFLEYIREQVDSFTIGVSQKMLENKKFHHLNEKERNILEAPSKDDIEDDDGENHVPFTVHYSPEIILGDLEALTL